MLVIAFHYKEVW